MRTKFVVRKNKLYWTGHDWTDSPACARTFDLEVTAVICAVSLDATVARHKDSQKRHTSKGRSQTSIDIVQWIGTQPDGATLDEVVQQFRLRNRENAYIRLRMLVKAGQLSSQGSQKNTRYFSANQLSILSFTP